MLRKRAAARKNGWFSLAFWQLLHFYCHIVKMQENSFCELGQPETLPCFAQVTAVPLLMAWGAPGSSPSLWLGRKSVPSCPCALQHPPLAHLSQWCLREDAITSTTWSFLNQHAVISFQNKANTDTRIMCFISSSVGSEEGYFEAQI